VPSRRPPPILLAAIAATAVILPCTLDRALDQPAPRASDVRLDQQPLIGLTGGVTVREVTSPQPFSMVALTGGDLTGTTARVRAKRGDGSWGPWYEAETVESGAVDGPSGSAHGPRGTDPVFVGNTRSVQIVVTRPIGAPVTKAPPTTAPAKFGLGYRPASVERPLPQNISAVLISPPQAPADRRGSSAGPSGAPKNRSAAVTRCTATAFARR
jgi:uncharacterized protein with LGFP repeats